MIYVNPRLVADGYRPRFEESSTPNDVVVFPGELIERVGMVHGHSDVAVPEPYVQFIVAGARGLRTWRNGAPDPFGWMVYSWTDAVALANAEYERVLTPDQDVPEEEQQGDLASLRKWGFWLPIGASSDRHDHFLCCDRRQKCFGEVVDCNDGGPAYGLVRDARWKGFAEYIRG